MYALTRRLHRKRELLGEEPCDEAIVCLLASAGELWEQTRRPAPPV